MIIENGIKKADLIKIVESANVYTDSEIKGSELMQKKAKKSLLKEIENAESIDVDFNQRGEWSFCLNIEDYVRRYSWIIEEGGIFLYSTYVKKR